MYTVACIRKEYINPYIYLPSLSLILIRPNDYTSACFTSYILLLQIFPLTVFLSHTVLTLQNITNVFLLLD